MPTHQEQFESSRRGPRTRVRLVLSHSAGQWILGKMASKLADELAATGIDADVSDVPLATADINHYVLFYQLVSKPITKTTVGVTHVDDFRKLGVLRRQMTDVDAAICLSHSTSDQLVMAGISRDRVCVVPPAHDGSAKIRRTRIAIATRVYDDGRKREKLLMQLARRMRLDEFHFDICGDGWEPTIVDLRTAGATVSYSPGTGDHRANYDEIQNMLASADFYLYLGMDEGSLGTLDALAAGVPTITTPQGFHLDIPGAIAYPVTDLEDLVSVFSSLALERRARAGAVSGLTWRHAAEQHAAIWRRILLGQAAHLPGEAPQRADQVYRFSATQRIRQMSTFYLRPFVLRVKAGLARLR